jgi:exosome complex component RRP42
MMEIQKQLKRDSLLAILAQGKRADERGKMDYRTTTVKKNVLQNAEGSALASIGKTQVLCGIKFDIATPFSDRPNEGVLSTGAEFTPLGSHMFEPGPPSVDSIELARVVDRGIRSSNAINLQSFFIEEGKVLALYLDLYILDHDGNLFDAATLAGMAALQACRMPKVENGKIIRNEKTGNLPLSTSCVSCTFAKVDAYHLLDPSLDEEKGMDGRLTIATTPDYVCAAQKSGWAGYTQKDIMELVDMSFAKGAELRRYLQ